MEIEELQSISAANFDDITGKIKPLKEADAIKGYLGQLDVEQHDVIDPTKRPKKKIKKEGPDGKPMDDYVEVARNPVSFQKIISSRAASFLCGNPIRLKSNPVESNEVDFVAVVQAIWDQNKLDYKSLELALLQCQETECAELWYVEEAPQGYWDGTPFEGAKFRLRMMTLAYSKGDTLYPVFNSMGDMIAFGRAYKVESAGEDVDHYDLYMADRIVKADKATGSWTVASEPNPVGKILAVYYSQDKPEWYDVQALIDRFETTFSNQSDTNDYFGSPILALSGEVAGFASKGESGKTVQLKNGAKAEYLIWDQSPEAVENENDRLVKLIHYLTDTPDISFESMKGLGDFSGVALKMLFMASHLKASMKAGGGFGEGIQRRINLIKAFVQVINKGKFGSVNVSISPEFDYFLPKNIQEAISFLTDAVGAGKPIMSQETAVRLNPLVEDPDAELEKMNAESGNDHGDILTA